MIHPYFLLFEIAIYILFALCFGHAARRSRFRVMELIFAGLYGFLLEWLTIKQLHAYEYGQFLIVFDGAPLVIALAWAAIIYSSMEFSDRIRLPEAVRPALDGLLAVNIDLALDTIAIRLGMWTWAGIGLNDQWFGVPWGNFWAWFIVISSYSGFVRLLRRWQGRPVLQWLYVPTALLLSLVVLLFTNQLFRSVISKIGDGLIGPVVLLGGALLLILLNRPRVEKTGPPDPIILAVPLVNHVLMIIAGIIYGFYAQIPALGILGVSMLVIGMAVHLWPWWAARGKAVAEAASSPPHSLPTSE